MVIAVGDSTLLLLQNVTKFMRKIVLKRAMLIDTNLQLTEIGANEDGIVLKALDKSIECALTKDACGMRKKKCKRIFSDVLCAS